MHPWSADVEALFKAFRQASPWIGIIHGTATLRVMRVIFATTQRTDTFLGDGFQIRCR
jgi:hypothetical protein